VIGKKIGVTSAAVMNMLNVHQPDFGYLLNGMVYNEGEAIEAASLIQERAEGEIAFLMKRDTMGTRVTDRKSTRLNSSHDQISYAVFCLKKKKNNTL